jgi:ribosomal protein RSM22 (predicted rRNA methylase)
MPEGSPWASQRSTNYRTCTIAPPHGASGRVTLKLCRPDGTAGERLISRRDGAVFKAARRADWGDTLDL